jgi:hypothetical protein
MKVVYISDTGDDRNDGTSPAQAVRTHKRACQLGGARCEFHMDRVTLDGLLREARGRQGSPGKNLN